VRDALAFFDEAAAHGVRVIATTQQIDRATPAGRLTRTILAGVAEFEGELIRERTRAAMSAINAGRKPTRSGRPVGRPRKLTPDAISRARELRILNHSWPQVAQELGLKAESIRRADWASKPRPGAVGNIGSGEPVSSPGGTLGRE